MDDPRYFDSYSEHSKLPYQKLLLEKLLQNGCETNGKYILTTKNFGLPITSMLLIMRDSCQDLISLQNEADKIHKRAPKPFTSIDIEKKFDVTIDRDSPYFDDPWKVAEMPENDPTLYTSGGNIHYTAEYAYLDQYEHGSIKPGIISNHPDTIIKERWIKKQTSDHLNGASIPLIQIYKSLIIMLELSYAIHERVTNSEIRNFKKYSNKTLSVPIVKGVFNENNQSRGELIHTGEIGIKFHPIEAKFKFGKKNIEKIATDGFEETCAWVNQVYKNMYEALT